MNYTNFFTSILGRLKTKTYKREVGAALLVFLCYLALDAGNIETVKVLVYPFVGFASLAFGLDWKGKQDVMAK